MLGTKVLISSWLKSKPHTGFKKMRRSSLRFLLILGLFSFYINLSALDIAKMEPRIEIYSSEYPKYHVQVVTLSFFSNEMQEFVAPKQNFDKQNNLKKSIIDAINSPSGNILRGTALETVMDILNNSIFVPPWKQEMEVATELSDSSCTGKKTFFYQNTKLDQYEKSNKKIGLGISDCSMVPNGIHLEASIFLDDTMHAKFPMSIGLKDVYLYAQKLKEDKQIIIFIIEPLANF